MFPYMVENKAFPYYSAYARVPVPCGKCPSCLQSRSDAWAFRLEYQQRDSYNSYFLTLTYETDYLEKTPNGFKNLDRSAFPKFVRSLRKRFKNKVDIKYYHVGEYGSERRRPHYHAIVFNLPDTDFIWGNDEKGQPKAVSCLLDDCWGKGLVDIRHAEPDCIGYVTKYLHKGKSVPEHPNDDRVKEFSTMSKGLGIGYLSDHVVYWHSDDVTKTYVLHNGFKKPLPRYYRDKLYYCPVAKLAQSLITEDLQVQLENKRLQDYISRHGSKGGYTRSKWEARKASVINFKQRASAKRKDL